MTAEMAEALGDKAEAARYRTLSADVRRAFTAAYVAANGTVKGNSRTGYARGMGLVTEPSLVAEAGAKFVAKLALTGYHLRTGFIGGAAVFEIGSGSATFAAGPGGSR